MDEFHQFMLDFYHLTGINLQLYKRPQMERRLTSLRHKHGFTDFSAYVKAISQQPRLMNELMDKMTINVSEFLRNPERWASLMDWIQFPASRPFKAWSAACSTGEEPYTLALLMEEQGVASYEIAATDIDKNVLAQAQQGQYKEHQVKSLTEGHISKYFSVNHGSYVAKDILKRHVQFRYHNLLADEYPTEFDLIICRNVMIYFTDAAKQQVVAGFAKSLKPGGLLFVGSTEQFLRTDQHGLYSIAPFIYQKREG